MDIAKNMDQALETYRKARQSHEPFGTSNDASRAFTELASTLRALTCVNNHPDLFVKSSIGKGNWARVPWMAILDRRETTGLQAGVYIVYLFREDSTGVYLTLNQGVTDLTRQLGHTNALNQVRS